MQRNPYWPLNGPSFFPPCRDSVAVFFLAALREASASGQISRHGWQADDRTFPRNGNTFNDIEEHGSSEVIGSRSDTALLCMVI
jgi:hypothetical protein